MAADGDILQLTYHWTYSNAPGEDFECVFYYEKSGGTAGAQLLAELFESDVAPTFEPVQHGSWVGDRIIVLNLNDLGDFYNLDVNHPGDEGDNPMPPFVAWKFRYDRLERGHNNGAKRIPGVPENEWTGTTLQNAGVTGIPDVVDALETSLTSGADTYTPGIFRAAGTYLVGGTPTVFPDTIYVINNVSFQGVTTQNTRKR